MVDLVKKLKFSKIFSVKTHGLASEQSILLIAMRMYKRMARG